MAPEAGMERLVRGVGDPLIALFRARTTAGGEEGLPLETTVRAVLTWLIEEVRADQQFAPTSPAEVLDSCVTVLRQVRQYVLETVEQGVEGKAKMD